MEKIVGPLHGFYVATYAGLLPGAQRYSSNPKICRQKPVSYWEARCLFTTRLGPVPPDGRLIWPRGPSIGRLPPS